jgi:hypothetical protein
MTIFKGTEITAYVNVDDVEFVPADSLPTLPAAEKD